MLYFIISDTISKEIRLLYVKNIFYIAVCSYTFVNKNLKNNEANRLQPNFLFLRNLRLLVINVLGIALTKNKSKYINTNDL